MSSNEFMRDEASLIYCITVIHAVMQARLVG